jgi:hypothetical protein
LKKTLYTQKDQQCLNFFHQQLIELLIVAQKAAPTAGSKV